MSEIEKYRKGLVCLVPNESKINSDSMLLTSHEKTLCDCQVLEIFAAHQIQIEIRAALAEGEVCK